MYVRATKKLKIYTMKLSPVKLQNPVQELFFMISPPRHIMSDVSVLKDDVQYLIGRKFEGRHSTAHISLFKYNDVHTKDMVRFVQSKAHEFEPFNVFLKDFGVFYNGSQRTIYMDIVNKYPIREIFQKLVKEDEHFTPNITIAKNLDVDDYLRCWPYLKTLNYGNQHFLCDRITVLSRTDNNWTHYKDIMLGE
jgi:2'-5' RNA ligase